MDTLQAVCQVVPVASGWQVVSEPLTCPFTAPTDSSFKAYLETSLPNEPYEIQSNEQLAQLLSTGIVCCCRLFKLMSVVSCGARELVVRDLDSLDLNMVCHCIVALRTGYKLPAEAGDLTLNDLSVLARRALECGMTETRLAHFLHISVAQLQWLTTTAEWQGYHYRDCQSVLLVLSRSHSSSGWPH